MDEVVVVDGTKTSSASKMGKIPIDVGKDIKVGYLQGSRVKIMEN